LILERLAGLDQSNAKAPNGLTFELKSVAFRQVKGTLVPKETMAITMINPDELCAHSFFESHCWAKLKTIVFCAVMWHGPNSQSAELLKVASLDFAETDDLILEIKADYDLIRQKLIEDGFAALTGKDGKWIQARTKGAGHGSTSRAFYARTRLVKKIFEMAGASDVLIDKLAA
jgi:DNA mismatch repair protein MutH